MNNPKSKKTGQNFRKTKKLQNIYEKSKNKFKKLIFHIFCQKREKIAQLADPGATFDERRAISAFLRLWLGHEKVV